MSVLPWTTMAPSPSIERIASIVAPGSGPFITRSPPTATTSGFSRLIALRTASSAARLPWTSDRTATRVLTAGSLQDACRRDDEAEERLACHLAVDRRDPPAPAEPGAELLHRDLEAEDVAGDDDPLEPGLLDRSEQADLVAEPGLLGDIDGHRLGERLDLEDAGHDGQAREVTLGPELGRGHALLADDPLGLGLVLDDPVDHQHRPAMRDQALDVVGRMDDRGHGWGGLSLGPGQAVAVRAAAARNAAPPTRSSRLVVIRPSRNVSFSRSALWISTFVVTSVLSSSSRAALERAIAVTRSGPQTMSLPSSES